VQKHVFKRTRNARIPSNNSALLKGGGSRESEEYGVWRVVCGAQCIAVRQGEDDVVCGFDNQVSALNGRFCAAPCNIKGQREAATSDSS